MDRFLLPIDDELPQEFIQEIEDIEKFRFTADSESKIRNYQIYWNKFQDWCIDHRLKALPTHPRIIELYLNQMLKTGYLKPDGSPADYKLPTYMMTLAAINEAHKSYGLEKPTDEKLRKFNKALAKKFRAEGKDKAAPIRKKEILAICQELLTDDSPKSIRDRAVIILGFYGAFRRSELAQMRWKDLEWMEDKGGYAYTLPYSKTDQTGRGKKKSFSYKAEIAICPVRVINKLRAFSQGDNLFMTFSKGGKMLTDSMSEKTVSRIIKKYFGADAKAHGLRAGFITEADAKGYTLTQIKKQTGHEHLPTLAEYVAGRDVFENNPETGL